MYKCLFVCLLSFQLGSTLKCYNCQSSPTNDCTDVKKLSVAQCTPVRDAYPPVCIRKILYSALGQNITLQCVNQQTTLECDPPHNYTVVYCNMCQEDLCNGQTNLQTTYGLPVILGLLTIYFSLKYFE